MQNKRIPAAWSTVLTLALACAFAAPTRGADAAAAGTGNASIVRHLAGEYAYRTLGDGRARGSERFELIAHPDGTRTLVMWNDLFARNGQIHAVLRVGADFRPLAASYTYFNDGAFKGSGSFVLADRRLSGTVRTATGELLEQELEVPDNVSFALHPLAGDGWHAWYVGSEAGNEVRGAMVNFDASADTARPALAHLQEQAWRYEGAESIEVPAGRFDAQRYAGAGATVWVTGPDRVLVRFLWPQFDREYVLTRLEQATPAREAP